MNRTQQSCAPSDDWRETWRGNMRIVRNAKRARLLRRRGVPMWSLIEHGRPLWCWFTEAVQL